MLQLLLVSTAALRGWSAGWLPGQHSVKATETLLEKGGKRGNWNSLKTPGERGVHFLRLNFKNSSTPHLVLTSFKIHCNSDCSPLSPLVPLYHKLHHLSLGFMCYFRTSSTFVPFIVHFPPSSLQPSLKSRRLSIPYSNPPTIFPLNLEKHLKFLPWSPRPPGALTRIHSALTPLLQWLRPICFFQSRPVCFTLGWLLPHAHSFTLLCLEEVISGYTI